MLGKGIIETGIAISLIIFVFFLGVTAYIHYRIQKEMPKDLPPGATRWKRIFPVLYIHMMLLIIRSCFRVAEFEEGYNGKLATTEAYAYGLDVLMVIILLIIWIPFHPTYLGIQNDDAIEDIKETETKIDATSPSNLPV